MVMGLHYGGGALSSKVSGGGVLWFW
jgi:hypothetical protein